MAQWADEAEFALSVPDHLSYAEAAAIPCAGITAFNALFESGQTTKDSTVLVLGSGGVSVYGAQFAKAVGARVIATTSSGEKAEKYKSLGVDHVINYRDTPNWAQEVKRLTDGEGVDQVLEIGGKGTLMEAIRSVKPKGVVHIISGSNEAPSYSAPDLAFAIIGAEAKLNGIATGGKAVAERLDSFIIQHRIKPLLDPKVFGWTEVKEAFRYLEQGSHFGKVVIKID
ncbi:unnamed protein product [Rhizoctonia solani]|uniref:Enoyl reductase (ER) domain-containing protein n=1 Tax=Rhizoctonia solani TaxID=456999 RepID=A0A8H3BC35_9AGAM|nr:unnamed protein product [Rhizoctonia solani]